MDVYDLSHAQKRICYTEMIEPGTAINNLGGLAIYHDASSLTVLRQAILLFFERNSVLRTRCVLEDAAHRQRLSDDPWQPLPIMDFSDQADPDAAVLAFAKDQMTVPLAFENSQLFDCQLVRLAEDKIGFFLKLHHFIADGWSFMLLSREIADAYARLRSGRNAESEHRGDYSSVVKAESRYLGSPRFERDRDYWARKYAVLPELSAYPRSESLVGQRLTKSLGTPLSAEFRQAAQHFEISENDLLVAIGVLLMADRFDLDDVTIGVPVHNRTTRAQREMLGMFTSTAPCRFPCERQLGVTQFVTNLSRQLKKDLRHQKYPFDQLAKDLALLRHGDSRLFHLSANFYNTRTQESTAGSKIENYEVFNGYPAHELHFVLKPELGSTDLELLVDYRDDCYSLLQASQIARRFMQLIQLLVGASSQSLGELMGRLNATPIAEPGPFPKRAQPYDHDRTIVQLIARQIQATPDKVALEGHGGRLTYRQLGEAIARFSARLIAQQINAGDVVLVMAHPSTEFVVAILALMQCGATYCPVDVATPEDRVRLIARQSNAVALLDATHCQIDLACRRLDLGGLFAECMAARESVELDVLQSRTVGSDDPAYIIFTSGSTGRPKGVVVHHRGLVNYANWASFTYLNHADVVPLYSSIAFDLTITSIFPPLLAGATVVSYRERPDDQHVLLRVLDDNLCTAIKLTPAHLNLVQRKVLSTSNIRCLVVGGEALSKAVAERTLEQLGGDVRIYNEYGPTETVVGCMIHQFDPDETYPEVPIGVPIVNTAIYLLDEQQRPARAGEPGEIYIAGDGVACGYVNEPSLTQAAFLDDPFVLGQRMYRSGDQALFQDGVIHYLGRNDDQIKLNGYRIECAEIENTLLARDEVAAAKVLLRAIGNGSPQLCAYLVADVDADVDVGVYADYLGQRLPKYMIPSHFVRLPSMPLTHNGKVDVNALPEPSTTHTVNEASPTPFDPSAANTLLQAAAVVLDTPSVAVDDSFIGLGGDSIGAIQLSTYLAERDCQLAVKDIIASATFAQMMNVMTVGKVQSRVCQGPATGEFTLGPMARWFMGQGHANPDHYSQFVVLEVQADRYVDVQNALSKLVQHHDVFRANKDRASSAFFFNAQLLDADFSVEILDDTPSEKNWTRVARSMAEQIELTSGFLLRAAWLKGEGQTARLILVGHHVAVDGVSWQILLDQLAMLLSGDTELPSKTLSCSQWATQISQDGHFDHELRYWQTLLQKQTPLFANSSGRHLQQDLQITKTHWLSPEDTCALLTTVKARYQSQTQELLLAALALTIERFFGCRQVLVDCETHGRHGFEQSLAHSVGWFTGMAPLLLTMNFSTWAQRIRSVRKSLDAQPEHGTGFGFLRHVQALLEDRDDFRLRFNYLGELGKRLNSKLLKVTDFGLTQSPDNRLTSPLEFNLSVHQGRLGIEVVTSSALISDQELTRLVWLYQQAIADLIDDSTEKLDEAISTVGSKTLEIDQEDLLEILG